MCIKSAWYYQSTSRRAIIEDVDEELWLYPLDGPPCTKSRMTPYHGPDPRQEPEHFTSIPAKELRIFFQLELAEQQQEEEKQEDELELEL